MARRTREIVASGQRYRDIFPGVFGPSQTEWTVDDVFVATDGMEYARLSCANDPTQQKTLSLAVLADRRRFARVIELAAYGQPRRD
jgi:hypothetical protein